MYTEITRCTLRNKMYTNVGRQFIRRFLLPLVRTEYKNSDLQWKGGGLEHDRRHGVFAGRELMKNKKKKKSDDFTVCISSH